MISPKRRKAVICTPYDQSRSTLNSLSNTHFFFRAIVTRFFQSIFSSESAFLQSWIPGRGPTTRWLFLPAPYNPPHPSDYLPCHPESNTRVDSPRNVPNAPRNTLRPFRERRGSNRMRRLSTHPGCNTRDHPLVALHPPTAPPKSLA